MLRERESSRNASRRTRLQEKSVSRRDRPTEHSKGEIEKSATELEKPSKPNAERLRRKGKIRRRTRLRPRKKLQRKQEMSAR